jgi:hypothetical protein
MAHCKTDEAQSLLGRYQQAESWVLSAWTDGSATVAFRRQRSFVGRECPGQGARAGPVLAIVRLGPIEAWIIDDTGFPKKREHPIGVTWQCCGQLGKQVQLSDRGVAVGCRSAASLPVAYRLHLPQDWAEDRKRQTEMARQKYDARLRRKPICSK